MARVLCRRLCPAFRTAAILLGLLLPAFARTEAAPSMPDDRHNARTHEEVLLPHSGRMRNCVRRLLPRPDLDTAPALCSPCHAHTVRSVTRSPHATCADIINRTRYLWGAQSSPLPATYGLRPPLRSLPPASQRPRSPAMLADDFLRENCLHCHLGTSGRPGTDRETGCTACHSPERSAVPDDRCLSCHNRNHAGGDYCGMYERDDHAVYRQAVTGGRRVPQAFGTAVHYLVQDVHAEAGLMCTDCHTSAEIMGYSNAAPPSCTGCHGGYDRSMPNTILPNISRHADAFFHLGRDGKLRSMPLLPETPAHDPDNHGRLRCSACHAQWTFGDYGLSAVRRDHGPSPGQWTVARRFRRWEHTILGVDEYGRISVLRPMHQYLVSYVDRLGRTVMDSIAPERGDGTGPGRAFTPYTPHTTGPAGRRCDGCHLNPVAAGLGMSGSFDPYPQSTDLGIFKAAPPVHPDARLLNRAEVRRLLDPSPRFRRLFAEHLLTGNLSQGGTP